MPGKGGDVASCRPWPRAPGGRGGGEGATGGCGVRSARGRGPCARRDHGWRGHAISPGGRPAEEGAGARLLPRSLGHLVGTYVLTKGPNDCIVLAVAGRHRLPGHGRASTGGGGAGGRRDAVWPSHPGEPWATRGTGEQGFRAPRRGARSAWETGRGEVQGIDVAGTAAKCGRGTAAAASRGNGLGSPNVGDDGDPTRAGRGARIVPTAAPPFSEGEEIQP